MNSDRFIKGQRRYFKGSYQQFRAFGGPAVYFHEECLRAGREEMLSKRHVELIYATLVSWGMHRLGKGSTKLSEWEEFHGSLVAQRSRFEAMRGQRMIAMSEGEYAEAIRALRPAYDALRLSERHALGVAI